MLCPRQKLGVIKFQITKHDELLLTTQHLLVTLSHSHTEWADLQDIRNLITNYYKMLERK